MKEIYIYRNMSENDKGRLKDYQKNYQQAMKKL